MCLPNSRVASCVFSPQLDPKLLKVCATPPFTPTMPKQFWAGAQETLAERRDQRVHVPEPSGGESWWYRGWADLGLEVCFLKVSPVLEALVTLSVWPDAATQARGAVSQRTQLQFSHFYMPCYTHHFWTSQKPMHFWALAIKHKVLGQAVKSLKWKSILSPVHGD